MKLAIWRTLVCAAGALLALLVVQSAASWLGSRLDDAGRVTARAAGPLAANEMLERLHSQGLGDTELDAITLWHDPTHAALAHGRSGRVHAFDPYTGELLRHGGDTSVDHAPRWLTPLWATSMGRGLLTLAALLCAAACAWRWRQPGRLRAVHRALLAVATLAAGVHLVAAVMAWWWPADDALPAPAAAAPVALDNDVWQRFDDAVAGAYESVTLQLPSHARDPLRFEYLAPGDAAGHLSRLTLQASGGDEPLSLEPWQALPLARQLPVLLPAVHGGQWLGVAGVAFMLAASLLLPLLAWWPRRAALTKPAAGTEEELLVVYASQSGTAEQLARRSVAALQAGGRSARLQDLGHLADAKLSQAGRVLFLLATTGQGEVPDHARPFAHRALSLDSAQAPSLQSLRYGLLSLGDRRYDDFCGFGRAVESWLNRQGARPMFDTIEVDRSDAAALQAWQSHLATLCEPGAATVTPWQAPEFDTWRLVQRRCLSSGSTGLPAFFVELEPLDAGSARWQAGDIAEVWCPSIDGDGGAVREYSIASIEADGAVQLLVRQTRAPDGRVGLGSGWLTQRLEEGAELQLRIRSNAGFHAPPGDDRPLVLIGNGTGLAGLRAHLRQRAHSGRTTRNWLLFGERQAAHDFYFRDEIERWQREGLLTEVDLAFSRDQAQRVYVQHRLHEQRGRLATWLADGAAVYVCGSATGMAPEVEAVLRDVVGAAQLDELVAAGRYRRDVY